MRDAVEIPWPVAEVAAHDLTRDDDNEGETGMTQPPPPPAGSSEQTPGGRWKTWHLAAAAGLALIVGIGLGGVGGDDADGGATAAGDSRELQEEIERLQGEIDERDQALAEAAERAESASDGEEAGSPEPDASTDDDVGADQSDRGTLALGETGVIGDYEVTVTDFTADDTEAVLAANQFNEDPENGLYGTVTFDATYTGEGEGMPGFDLSAALVIDGVQHGDTDCDAVVENDAMNAPTLENGGTAAGQVFCFDHPGLNDSAALFFDETMSFDDTRVYWQID